MSTLNAIIVDDESLARRGLSLRLQHIPQVDVIAECTNGAEALQAIAQHSPDLVFLDIQMNDGTGFDLLEMLPETDFTVIFVTAHDRYAPQALKSGAVDCLLKPVSASRLNDAMTHLKHSMEVEKAKQASMNANDHPKNGL